ncbi:MAG: hypothetical protein KF716_26530 [Anaerolineae bacterium]|nr:hypothetical protein [Anaerolineae bacterium]
MTRKLLGMTALVAGLLISGCNSQLVLERVVTATPNPNIVVITVTPADGATAEANTTTTTAVAAAPTATPSTEPSVAATVQPTPTTIPIQSTPTLSPFPTETKQTIYIAQQSFEKGIIFWIQARKIMWVLIQDPSNPNVGQWFIYQDTFDETVDKDAELAPPSGLYAPRRGFGKLWTQTPGLRDALGWATTPEFGLNTEYKYQPGGYLDPNNQYVPGPGTHFITTLGREVYALSEPDPTNNKLATWQRVS